MRRFNRRQRAALYIASGGKCALCGKPLGQHWHADHIQPYSRDGETDVLNGQALCPECNQRKGNRMLPMWPEQPPMRKWQQELRSDYHAANKTNFVIVAAPGAGKTIAVLRLVHDLLNNGVISRAIVVTPSKALKKHWRNVAAKYGINLDATWENDLLRELRPGYHGLSVTYQTVARLPEIYEKLCSSVPTVVVMDEPHHAGETREWGNAVRRAFQPASRRILATGTPYRTDNLPIPFIEVDADGVYVRDHTYGLGKALLDRVLCHPFFPSYEGTATWVNQDGEIVTATLTDKLDETGASQRLKAITDPRGDWIRKIFAEANAQLNKVRSTYLSNAGGIVIARDKMHADALAMKLNEITGEQISIVYSEMDDPESVIEKFKNSDQKWIVAVRMISEGVDIPRLKVLVYATNIVTRLYFVQAVGRVMRIVLPLNPDNDQFCYVYFPADTRLIEFAQDIKTESLGMVDLELAELERRVTEQPKDPDEKERAKSPSIIFVESDGKAGDVFVPDGRVSQNEIAAAKQLIAAQSLRIDEILLARVIQIIKPGDANPTTPAKEEPLLDDVLRSYGRVANRLAAQVAQLEGKEPKDIHREWANMPGNNWQRNAGVDELKAKIKWLRGKLRSA